MHKKLTSITGLIVVAVIVLAVNLIAVVLFRGAKIDVTDERLYTLSQGSKQILKSLDDEITGTLYYSKTAIQDIPQLKLYADRVIDMLREYESNSDGNFRLEIRDPRPDTEIEEWAQRYGLKGLPSNTGEQLYLGLVLKDESGHEQVIPFFHPDQEQTLEYDVSRTLYNLSHPEKKKVAVLSSLNVTGQQPQPNPMMPMPQQQQQRAWMFIQQLRASNTVEALEPDVNQIPGDTDLLLLVHPKNLSETAQYAIDQYVLKGGKVLAFLDPFSSVERASSPMGQNPQMLMQASFSSNLPRLLDAWGVAMETGENQNPMMGMGGGGEAAKIVADPNLALQTQTEQGAQDFMLWLRLPPENMNQNEIVTSQLEDVMLFDAGALTKTTTSDEIEVTPLLETTDEASTIEDMMRKFGLNPDSLRKGYKPGSSPISLAVRITGKFKSAFPDGKPLDTTEDGEKLPAEKTADHLTESQEPTTIVVVSDTDMIADEYSVRVQNIMGMQMAQPLNDNLAFATNVVENLTGSEELISLRSRGKSQRPFTRVQEIQRSAQEKWRVTEEELSAKLEGANRRLSELQRGTQDTQALNQAYIAEVSKLRNERAETQRELRTVRRNLREDVEALAFKVKFVNIALIPLAVVFLGAIIGIIRLMRKRAA